MAKFTIREINRYIYQNICNKVWHVPRAMFLSLDTEWFMLRWRGRDDDIKVSVLNDIKCGLYLLQNEDDKG